MDKQQKSKGTPSLGVCAQITNKDKDEDDDGVECHHHHHS